MAALSIARHSSIRTPPDGVNHSKPVITPHKYESQLRRGPTPLIDFRHDPRNQTDPLSFLLSVINSAFHKLPPTSLVNAREKLLSRIFIDLPNMLLSIVQIYSVRTEF